jgi:hypothetical protein
MGTLRFLFWIRGSNLDARLAQTGTSFQRRRNGQREETMCDERRKSFAHLPQSCTSILIDMRLSPAHTAPTSKQELVESIIIILAT